MVELFKIKYKFQTDIDISGKLMVNKGKITVKGCSAFLHFFPFSKWHDSGCIDIIPSLTWAHLLVPPEATMEMVIIRLYFQTKLCHICKLARDNNAVISIMCHSHCCQCLIKVKTTGGYMSSSLIFSLHCAPGGGERQVENPQPCQWSHLILRNKIKRKWR